MQETPRDLRHVGCCHSDVDISVMTDIFLLTLNIHKAKMSKSGPLGPFVLKTNTCHKFYFQLQYLREEQILESAYCQEYVKAVSKNFECMIRYQMPGEKENAIKELEQVINGILYTVPCNNQAGSTNDIFKKATFPRCHEIHH